MTSETAAVGGWSLERLLGEVVGAGPKSADDMTAEQAGEAFTRILEGEPDPTTLGAFWLANRWKSNTPTELAAFVDAMRSGSVRPAVPSVDPVDCGANYDGKRSTALFGVAAGLVSAASGTPVVVHSADRVPTKRGAAYRHVLESLGVVTDLEPAESAAMVDATGFGFYDATRFNPGVDALLDRRERMGVRTFVNTVETLANPADASVHLGSFYHLAFAKRVIETLRRADSLRLDRVLLFQGLEGYDDIRPGHTTVAEYRDGSIDDFAIETAEYGMSLDRAALEVDAVAADSAALTESIIGGERTGPLADAVALNAALRIYAGGRVATLDEALEEAQRVLAGGDARPVLDAIRAFDP